jgi:hypothetical protein
MKDGKRHLLFLANSADEKAVKNACNLKTTWEIMALFHE